MSALINVALSTTERGFVIGEFVDMFLDPCSIEETPFLEVAPAMWFGHWPGRRMLLSQAHVAALLPVLQHFAATGKLPTDRPSNETAPWWRRAGRKLLLNLIAGSKAWDR